MNVLPFTDRFDASVAAWGEEKLITAIRRWLGSASPRPPFGIGDDCAVLPPSRRPQLITVDPVIFGRHFDASVPPRAVGEKLLKRNLSDIAAMGGRPVAAVLALTLDPRVDRAWLESFYRGLAVSARNYKVPIVGGDIAQAEGIFSASLTLLGEATTRRVVTRTGAKRGDALYVTGSLGRSLATGHHFRFTPRLAEGAWLARQKCVRAMMDVSDGLAKDLHALTPRGTTPALVADAIPRRDNADLRAALTDGEDYELVFAIDGRVAEETFTAAWSRAFPHTRLSRIGRLVRRRELPDDAVKLSDFHGYEHLQPSSR